MCIIYSTCIFYMCCVCSRIRETQQLQIRFQMQSDSAWQCRVACSRCGFAEAQNASAACSVTCLAASLDSERVGQRSSLFEFLGLCFSFFCLSTVIHPYSFWGCPIVHEEQTTVWNGMSDLVMLNSVTKNDKNWDGFLRKVGIPIIPWFMIIFGMKMVSPMFYLYIQ